MCLSSSFDDSSEEEARCTVLIKFLVLCLRTLEGFCGMPKYGSKELPAVVGFDLAAAAIGSFERILLTLERRSSSKSKPAESSDETLEDLLFLDFFLPFEVFFIFVCLFFLVLGDTFNLSCDLLGFCLSISVIDLIASFDKLDVRF